MIDLSQIQRFRFLGQTNSWQIRQLDNSMVFA
jgi:hypothetical protein